MKRALIVEANPFHGECLPFFIKYFLDNGYFVDVFINGELFSEQPLCMFDNTSNINIVPNTATNIFKLFNSIDLRRYDALFFNSEHIGCNGKWASVFDFITISIPHMHTICLQHRHDFITHKLKKISSVVVLKKFVSCESIFEVNAHYFGEIPSHAKNPVVKFIVVGNIEAKRKNHNALIKAAQNLLSSGVNNFKIIVVGRGEMSLIPEPLKKHFDIRGRLSYPDMYDIIKQSDFFLTLLSPDNPEHDWYITGGTSGSFQLIYGFNIPPVIARKFASIHGFNQDNSILYDNDIDLSDAMIAAIKMSAKSYVDMRRKLKMLSTQIQNKSYIEMKHAIEKTYSFVPIKRAFSFSIYYLFGFIPMLSISDSK